MIISRPEKTSWDIHCRARGSTERREKEPFAAPQPIPCFSTDFSGHGALHRNPPCGGSSRLVTNQMVNQSSCMPVTNGIFKTGAWLRYTNSTVLTTCDHCIVLRRALMYKYYFYVSSLSAEMKLETVDVK